MPAISLTVPAIGAAILPSDLAAPVTALIGAVKGVASRPRKLFFGGAGFGGSGFGSGFGGSVGVAGWGGIGGGPAGVGVSADGYGFSGGGVG